MTAHAPVAAPELAEAAARIMTRCDRLAAVTSTPAAITRVHLSPEHARVNDICGEWMRAIGMTTWVDAAGNLIGRLAPRLDGVDDAIPALVLGSHLDSVPDAGRYDGIVGVLIGIEVVRLLRTTDAQGRWLSPFPFAIDVVGFADEEGARFGRALLGSAAFAGEWDPSWWELRDDAGITLREAAVEFGLEPDRIGEAARNADELIGYLEAHIEQGPDLDRSGEPLAVVSSIASARRFQLVVTGEARHAGGTPYDLRRDALLGASEAALAVERLCRAEHHIVGTVGQFDAFPGAVNVIPGEVQLSIDLRGEFDDHRDHVWTGISHELDEIMGRRGLTWTSREIHSAPAVFCAPILQDVLRAGVDSVQGGVRGNRDAPTLFSRAGHDAMSLARLTDVGMLFLRNPDGISHHPDEAVAAADVQRGVSALVHAVRLVAAEPR